MGDIPVGKDGVPGGRKAVEDAGNLGIGQLWGPKWQISHGWASLNQTLGALQAKPGQTCYPGFFQEQGNKTLLS